MATAEQVSNSSCLAAYRDATLQRPQGHLINGRLAAWPFMGSTICSSRRSARGPISGPYAAWTHALIRKQQTQDQQRARPGGIPTCLALCRSWHKAVTTGSADGRSHTIDDGIADMFGQDVCSPAPLWPPAYLQTAMIGLQQYAALNFRKGRSGTASLRRQQRHPAQGKGSPWMAADMPMLWHALFSAITLWKSEALHSRCKRGERGWVPAKLLLSLDEVMLAPCRRVTQLGLPPKKPCLFCKFCVGSCIGFENQAMHACIPGCAIHDIAGWSNVVASYPRSSHCQNTLA